MPGRPSPSIPVRLASLGFLFALVAIAPRARAAPCAAETTAWIEAAARAIERPISAVQCYPGLARIRLAPAGAPPLDVEIAEPPGPAFRRAGRLRVSPIVEIAD